MKSIRFVLCFAAILFTLTIQSVTAQTATNTTLAVTSGGSAVAQVPAKTVVTLTATVQAGGTAIELGTVNFCDASAKSCTDIHLLGTAQLTKAGTAVMKFRPGPGSHSYKAVFLGTKSNAASASIAAALTVTAPAVTGVSPTTTVIAESGNPEDYTLTATVNGPRGIASPTGTVSFEDTSDGNTVLDTATLGAGTPGFRWLNAQNIFTYWAPQSVAAGDFNGDGIQDLASAGDSGVTILLGNGDGTFTAKSSVDGCPVADQISVADFNGDGIPDLAVTCPPARTVNVYLGNGDGTFTLKSSPAAGYWSNGIGVGDFNGDGKLDVAVANAGDDNLTILLGNGDGTFTAAPNVPVPGGTWDNVHVGDFNGDGIPDLAFSNAYATNNSVSILLGNGDGTFTAAPSVATGNGNGGVFVGDFNGDGKQDLALSYSDGQGNTILKIMLGNGDGTFTALPAGPTTLPYSTYFIPGDFDGDGVLDLFVMDTADNTARLLLGSGDGTFTTSAAIPSPFSQWNQNVAADFNGDGISDMAMTCYGACNFTVWVALTQPTQVATATASGISIIGASTKHQVDAVYSGDTNHQDSTSGTVALTAVPGPHLAFTTAPLAKLQAGQSPGTVAVSVENASNNVVTTSSATITLTVTGPKSYSKTYTATASSGVATFASLPSISRIGSYSYTATDTPDGLSQAAASESVWTPPPVGDAEAVRDATTLSTTIAQADKLAVSGWAADPSLGAPLSSVQVLIDGNAVGNATVGLPRPDVAARQNNSAYLLSGWTFTYPATGLSVGTHTVQAVAYDSYGASAPLSAMGTVSKSRLSVTVAATQAWGPPLGFIDGITDATTNSATVAQADNLLVSGWAVDAHDNAPVSQVQVLIDGNPAGNATLNITRPDVARNQNNNAWLHSGWSFTYAASGLSVGNHTASAVVTDSLGSSTTLRSKSFTVATTQSFGPPFGAVDQAVDATTLATTVSQADNLLVTGWAADAHDGSPVSQVQILIDGTSVGNATLGLKRPDVAQKRGSAYLNSGWTFTYSASGLSLGGHTIEAVATDSLSNSTTLAYRAITVTQ